MVAESHLPGGGRDGGTSAWSIQQTGRLGSLPVCTTETEEICYVWEQRLIVRAWRRRLRCPITGGCVLVGGGGSRQGGLQPQDQGASGGTAGLVCMQGCKGALLSMDNLYLLYLCLHGAAFMISAKAEAICSWGLCP